jgi:prevent-host-death family protein
MIDLPISDARAGLADAIKRSKKSPVSISKHGKPVAVLISPSLYEKFISQIEEDADLAAFDNADKEFNYAIPWEQVKKDLGLV